MAMASRSAIAPLVVARRACSGTPYYGPDTLEGLLEKHLAPSSIRKRRDEDDPVERAHLTSTRREVLSLYRDILRATRPFLWPNKDGVLWRDVLRASARQEFEQARYEKDPEVITKLLVVGRDAVEAAVDKLVEQHTKMLNKGNDNTGKRRLGFLALLEIEKGRCITTMQATSSYAGFQGAETNAAQIPKERDATREVKSGQTHNEKSFKRIGVDALISDGAQGSKTSSTGTSAHGRYRTLKRKLVLLQEESCALLEELESTQAEVRALEGDKVALLDRLLALEGLACNPYPPFRRHRKINTQM